MHYAHCLVIMNPLLNASSVLTKNNEMAIHTKNLQKLMTEIYKLLNHESPSFMGEFFVQRELTHDLRIKKTLQIPPTKTISFGITSLAFGGSILWNAMPDTIKRAENVFRFMKGIKAWNGDKKNVAVINVNK